MSNSTDGLCFKVVAPAAPPVFQNGKIVLQVYHIGWIISGSLALVAVITSFWLISKHLQWYTDKKEQRYIVRLLFMVPLYAIISFGSFLFWNHSTPIILVRDAYESIVLTAFFYLLLTYLSHDVEEQRRIFLKRGLSLEADAVARQKGEKLSQWVFPLGFIKWKPKDGLYFLQLMKWGVLQYCVIRPTTTLAAVILNYVGLYCEDSWGLGWGHIYITIVVSVSVSIAMYCLIQLYVPVAAELSKHKPLLKLFSVKAVVFLTFWQATFLSLLSMFGIVKANKYMTVDDVNIGIGAILETFEMMIFAFLHIRAFTYLPYQNPISKTYQGLPPSRTPQLRSLGHAMDFRETFREIWVGCVYMFDKIRGKEPKPDFGVIRESHYEEAFGRQRPFPGQLQWSPRMDLKTESTQDATFPAIEIEVDREVEIEIEGQRQWLLSDKYGRRGLHTKRERSEGLQEQIDRELEKLGYPKLYKKDKRELKPEIDIQPAGLRSWWCSIYNHISQSGQEAEEAEEEPFKHRRLSRLRSYRYHLRNNTQLKDMDRDIDDQPPQGILRSSNFQPQPPRHIASEHYDQDRFSSQNEDRLPPSDDAHTQNRHSGQPTFPVSFVSPGKRASRSPPGPSALPNSGFRTPTNGLPLSHDPSSSPYDSMFPFRFQADLTSRENKISPPMLGAQPGSSRRPPRNSLVMPDLLDPNRQSDSKQTPYLWDPPPPPPKDGQWSVPQDDPFIDRRSVHRREPATLPLDQEHRRGQVHKISPLVRQVGRLSSDDDAYISQVMYTKQPSNKRTTRL